ncbi:MAG: hypothetical protein U0002_00655 [Thermoanaerobaculia bacterium]
MSRRFRLTLSLLALAVAMVIGWRSLSFYRSRARILAETLPLLDPAVEEEARDSLRRASDPLDLSITASRWLINEALARTHERKGRQANLDRLALAEELASAAYRENPASWQAAMQCGAATYLLRSARRDTRLLTEPDAWEQPLRQALKLAPAEVEPARFLAIAYLELWHFLPLSRRAEARRLVATALADPASFDRIIVPWLSVARSLEDTVAPMPPDPEAWRKLAYLLAGKEDWPGVARAAEGGWQARKSQLEAQVATAQKELAAGRPQAARVSLLAALRNMPCEARLRPLFLSAMEQLPAGPVDPATATQLEAWLRWGLERCLAGDCPFSPNVFGRLGFAASEEVPAVRAAASLAAGDWPGAELLERRAGNLLGSDWARYRLLKARLLAARGKAREARAELPDATGEEDLDLARGWLAAELGLGGEGARSARWQRLGNRFSLLGVASRPIAGLEIPFASVPVEGAAVEVLLDGGQVAVAAVAPGTARLRLTATAPAGLHRLELATLASVSGVPVVPAPLDLSSH